MIFTSFGIAAALAAAEGAATTVVAAPVVLPVAGFTGAGFSIASSMMSAAAVANGGPITALSTVALLQSASVVSIPLAAQTVGLLGAFGSGAAAVAAAILL